MSNSTWMSNPNVKLLLYAGIAAMPVIISDLSSEKGVGWLTLCVVVANVLNAVKAYTSDPGTK